MTKIIPSRVTRLREGVGLSQSALARLASIDQGTINHIERGRLKFTKSIFAIADALGTTAEFLVGLTNNAASLKQRQKSNIRNDLNIVPVREIDLTLGMDPSNMDVPTTEEIRYFSNRWLKNYTRSSAQFLLFAQGIGDAMQPTLLDSDLLLIDCAQKRLSMADKIWVVAYANCVTIGRLRTLPQGKVEILSDNPSVGALTASESEIKLLGRVVAVVRKL